MPLSETIKRARAIPQQSGLQSRVPAPIPEATNQPLSRTILDTIKGLPRATYRTYSPIVQPVIERRAFEPLRPTPEEAKKQNLVRVGNSYIDPFGAIGAMEKVVSSAVLAKLAKEVNPKNVIQELLKLGVKGKKADEIAPIIAKSTDEKAISETITQALSRERGFVTSAKEVVDTEKIAGQYIPRETDPLAIKAKNLIKEDVITAERIALTESDDRAVAIASELLKKLGDDAARATDKLQADAIYERAAKIANTMAEKLTELGRSIQAASILGRLTPEGQVRFAAREIQKYNATKKPLARAVPELTGAQTKEIVEKMKAIQAMPEGEAKGIEFKKLQDTIKAIVPSTVLQKVIAIWKAGLLTGLKTTGLNIFSTTSHAMGTEILKDIPASAADILLSLFTGKRTTAFTLRGLPSGIQEGAQKGFRYLKTGYDTRDIATKLDYKQVNFKHKALQGYVDTVFRSLGATDQVFYYGALRRSLYNQAIAKSKNAKGVDVEFLAHNPTDEMSAYALADAETAVFQNKTKLGQAASALTRTIPAAQFVIPFARTPSSVAMQVVNYSPIGAFVEIGKQIARGKFDQRLLAQAIGRSSIGTGVLWTGTKLYQKGLMTLDYPKDERERELWKAEGKVPNAIKIGNKWRTVQSFGPAGPVMLIGGHFDRAIKETGSHTEAMIQAFFGTIKSFTEQTFLKGVNDVIAAITDPRQKARGVTASFVSSWIPTIINDIARATDPKERKVSAENPVKEVANRVVSRLPGFRQGLEPQVDVLGRERARAGNPLEVMIDPTRPSKDVSTPVTDELRRLMDAGFQVSPTLVGDRNGYAGLTPEQNTAMWKMAGDITNRSLTNLFKSQSYLALDDEDRTTTIKNFVTQATENARVAATIDATQGLQGQELIAKIAELKKSGLITKPVYNKFLKMR